MINWIKKLFKREPNLVMIEYLDEYYRPQVRTIEIPRKPIFKKRQVRVILDSCKHVLAITNRSGQDVYVSHKTPKDSE
jgi:hypothetical protein